MEKSIARQISEFSVGLKFEDLPDEVINEVKRYMYDSIGCAYGGYHTKDLNIIRDIYMEMGGNGEATVLGFGDKLPAVNATLSIHSWFALLTLMTFTGKMILHILQILFRLLGQLENW